MNTLKYPSKEIRIFAQDAIEERKTFRVDARLGKFRKNALQDYININFLGKGGRFSYIGVAMCGTLGALTANAFVSGKYRVEYADSKRGLLITFKCSERPGKANSCSKFST